MGIKADKCLLCTKPEVCDKLSFCVRQRLNEGGVNSSDELNHDCGGDLNTEFGEFLGYEPDNNAASEQGPATPADPAGI